MRPVHVVILLLAGALGGAMLMKVVHSRKPEIPVADAEPATPPATAPPEQVAPAVPAPALAEPEPVKPSPMPRPVSKSARLRTVTTIAASKPKAAVQPAPPSLPPPSATVAPPPVDAEPVQAPPPPPPPPVPQPHQVTLNAGMILPVRLVDGLSSERNAAGDLFAATLAQSLVADGLVVAPRGARVEGRVVAVERAHVRSAAAIALELTTLRTSDGQTVPIETVGHFEHADRGPVNHAETIAEAAILGAAIGAIAGGGKGAAIGAGIGGGAGAGDVLLTRRPLEMPPETMMTFRLKNPIQLTEVR